MTSDKNTSRREFLLQVGMVTGAGVLSPLDILANSSDGRMPAAVTVGQVMDRFIKEVPNAPFASTVDTLKSGSRETIITGIVTTMFATVPVIEKTAALGANFIIAHEPTFYNHLDETEWLERDPVYQYKAELLKKNNITIWRNHDYVHSLRSDGVMSGVLDQLGWGPYHTPGTHTVKIPSLTLKDLIQHVKETLGVAALRYEGDLSQPCANVLLMPGAAGGRRQIEALMAARPDVLICGEVAEWETPEYVRDARSKGDRLSLIVIGHSASEEGGSEFMASWLRKNVPNVNVTHIPSNNSLSVL